jgi:hypothetical protein
MTGIFGILESSSMQCYHDISPTQEFFFSIVTSIVYAYGGEMINTSSEIETVPLTITAVQLGRKDTRRSVRREHEENGLLLLVLESVGLDVDSGGGRWRRRRWWYCEGMHDRLDRRGQMSRSVRHDRGNVGQGQAGDRRLDRRWRARARDETDGVNVPAERADQVRRRRHVSTRRNGELHQNRRRRTDVARVVFGLHE